MPIFMKIPMGEVASTESPSETTLYDVVNPKLRAAEKFTWC